eukprot:CAMPEP_0194482858 /NCGR_PEP_ID=MMETSP0253-20130528/4613_1 /TAXON_ID=2966 /ORGANISM="Noctiluca scintillans" /LENGTH=42 /DNA_ID= /DNA_START= /DNA_END= /DNA_ORIENTATION=
MAKKVLTHKSFKGKPASKTTKVFVQNVCKDKGLVCPRHGMMA